MHMVQVIRPALLREGFEAMDRVHFEVTDDVSIIEALGLPVKLTPGSETNIKVSITKMRSLQNQCMPERSLQAQRCIMHKS